MLGRVVAVAAAEAPAHAPGIAKHRHSTATAEREEMRGWNKNKVTEKAERIQHTPLHLPQGTKHAAEVGVRRQTNLALLFGAALAGWRAWTKQSAPATQSVQGGKKTFEPAA